MYGVCQQGVKLGALHRIGEQSMSVLDEVQAILDRLKADLAAGLLIAPEGVSLNVTYPGDRYVHYSVYAGVVEDDPEDEVSPEAQAIVAAKSLSGASR